MKLGSWVLALCAFLAWGAPADAQDADNGAVAVANQAFYAALSGRDSKAMGAVWANKPYVINIGPRNRTIAVGYADAVTKYWPAAFETFSRISVTSKPTQIQTDGKLAWVVGTEDATLQPKTGGDPLRFKTFVTNVFEKDGDQWMMISHHAQIIPK